MRCARASSKRSETNRIIASASDGIRTEATSLLLQRPLHNGNGRLSKACQNRHKSPPEGGSLRRSKRCNATLASPQRGRSDACCNTRLTSPVTPRLKVALLLFDRRADPSFEEGIVPVS